MKSTLRTLSVAFVLPFTMLAMGCQSEPLEPEVSAEEARSIAAQALVGFNNADYAAWSAQWSATMKNAVSEEQFQTQRDALVATAGKWVSIQYVERELTLSDNYVAYALATEFENERVTMRLLFPQDAATIEDVRLQKAPPPGDGSKPDQECPAYLEECEPF